MSFFGEAIVDRIPNISSVEMCVGRGLKKGEIDYAIVSKGDKGVIIIKIDKFVGCFDYEDFFDHKIYTVLNYKESESTNEAYSKMMKWIGKMCKKVDGRYFNKINPYNHQVDYTIFNDRVIQEIYKIRKIKG